PVHVTLSSSTERGSTVHRPVDETDHPSDRRPAPSPTLATAGSADEPRRGRVGRGGRNVGRVKGRRWTGDRIRQKRRARNPSVQPSGSGFGKIRAKPANSARLARPAFSPHPGS